MVQWKSGYTVVVLCSTVVFITLIGAFVIMVTVGGTDPDVLLRFIAGPTIGNLISLGVITYLTVVDRKVQSAAKVLQTIKEQTNGHITTLIAAKTIQEPAAIVHDTDPNKEGLNNEGR